MPEISPILPSNSHLTPEIFLTYQLRLIPIHTTKFSTELNATICTCYRQETCFNQGKHPINKDFLQGPIPTLEDLPQILKSPCNFAVATGPLPHDPTQQLIIYDIDTPAMEEFQQNPSSDTAKFISSLPPTLTIQTPSNGLHFYYLIPSDQDIHNISTGFIDIRAKGGYALAPSSLNYTFHPDSLQTITFLSNPPTIPSNPRNTNQATSTLSNSKTRSKDNLVPLGERDAYIFNQLRKYTQGGMPLENLLNQTNNLYTHLEQPPKDIYTLSAIREKARYVHKQYQDPKAEEMYEHLIGIKKQLPLL